MPRTRFPAATRANARRHIEEHALAEAARIERLSRVREFVLGAQDGLLVPLGVVTGMAAANPGRAAILVAGLAEAVAGCIAMGGGSYLASEAEEALYAAEIADEGREVQEEPERETAELALVLEDEGLPREAAERVARGLATNPNVFLRTKVQKELGLSPDTGGAALGDALVVGLTYLGAAVIPLWPYAVLAPDGASADCQRRLHAGSSVRARYSERNRRPPATPARWPSGPRDRRRQRDCRLRYRPRRHCGRRLTVTGSPRRDG
jgi:VIT1/CCC1 family predicted Fe2+/Mn2+ transporter